MKRGLVRAAISSANASRSLTALAFRLCLGCRGKHPALGLVLVANVVECAPEGQLAGKWVISALIQQANLLAVEPLFFDLKISARRNSGESSSIAKRTASAAISNRLYLMLPAL